MNTYLDLARQGKTDGWRYLLAVPAILFAWLLVGGTPALLLIFLVNMDGNPATAFHAGGTFSGISLNLSFTIFMLAYLAFMAGICLAVRFIHRRRFLSLVTPSRSLDLRRLFQGLAVWFGLVVLFALLEATLYPGRYVLTLNLRTYIPFVFLALILIPIQTSAEELFFRAYLLQGFGLRNRNIWTLSFLSGFIFMLPHLLNPEAKLNYLLMGLSYFSIGALLAYITLRDGSLELALGVHAANNLFTVLFANAVVTALPSPSMFTVMKLDVVYLTVTTLAACLVFALIFLVPLRRKIPLQEPENNIRDSR